MSNQYSSTAYRATIDVDATVTLAKLAAMVDAIEGTQELVADLALEMAESIVNIAKENVPKGATGQLEESIHYEGDYPSLTFLADAQNKDGSYYGVFVEYGTSKMEARPYLEPAIDEGLRDFKAIIKDEVFKMLRGA